MPQAFPNRRITKQPIGVLIKESRHSLLKRQLLECVAANQRWKWYTMHLNQYHHNAYRRKRKKDMYNGTLVSQKKKQTKKTKIHG